MNIENENSEDLNDEVENEGQEDAEAATDTEDADGADVSGGDDQGGDVEDPVVTRARAMGWAPREDWRGPPDRWVDAEAFVERADRAPAVMQERFNKVSQELARERVARERDRRSFDQTVQRLEGMSKIALERQRKQIEDTYETRMRAAVESSDTEEFDRLRDQKNQELSEFEQAAADASKPVDPPDDDAGDAADAVPTVWSEAIDAWTAENGWFETDPTMRRYASTEHAILMAEQPGLSPQENLEKVREATRERFPEKFGMAPQQQQNGREQAAAQKASPAEGGSRQLGNARSKKRTAKDLPAEVRRQGQAFVEEGLFENMDEYAADYWALEGTQ